MALTTVSSLSEMYSASTSAVSGVATKPVEKTPETSVPEVIPTASEDEDAAEESNEG